MLSSSPSSSLNLQRTGWSNVNNYRSTRVFMSYSWESDAHKSGVRELSERLTRNGVNVRLDQWHIGP
ncbi:SEFIR domain-containing protein [Herbaspirillum sp.]|uniref:SEFIR domain-containing protein n=1 Tax=Herbaspirillum sp. TaxID=1890675 RepID=UPI00338D89DB